jgi:hypothetical protein
MKRCLPGLARLMLLFGGLGQAVMFLPLSVSIARATTYNLAADWSDIDNPNGVWTYREGTNPLPLIPNWTPLPSPVIQPAWAPSADSGNFLPAWFKSRSNNPEGLEVLMGDVVVHSTDDFNGRFSGIANVIWTSPLNRVLDISGAVWMTRDIGRGNEWNLLLNGVSLTSGNIFSGDPFNRANPFHFANGLNGPAALNAIAVSIGDVIELRIVRTTTFGDDVGVNLTITTITQDEEGPLSSNVVASPNPAAINTALLLTATVNDTLTGGSEIMTAEYSLDGGNFIAMNAQDGTFDEVSEAVTATVPAFAQAGVHEVCVDGTDAASNTGPVECILVAVYDPTAGFVTGGGWFDSPQGAYTPDPLLTGKATFGFVSKYKKGATSPTGMTQFELIVADLAFYSDVYEWLVVAGARAQFKGTGTINGLGNYGFLLTAIDGQISGGGGTDKFRIKIWDKNTSDTIVYDNQLGSSDSADPTTVIDGGQIIIHAK